MRFKDHPMLFVLTPLCVIAACLSFYRFMVAGTYIVEYEGDCDPATQSCYFACEDEECSVTYYHSWMQKRNDDLRALCGPDVTDCDAAYECLASDHHCEILYCDAAVEECIGPNAPPEELNPSL